ncbi:TPA: hypothetical protein HA361_04885 [Candidatus Woesearchaeota archaeon]|nr:hypothetical protein [Candidatus Woesearchaeota archaeon]HII68458.1 hypothetical protein [Candidatus Woesearchaeota archaeon]
MKIMVTFLSLLILLAGILPFLGDAGLGILPKVIPTSGIGYSIVISIIGAIGLAYGFMNQMIFGVERFVIIVIAVLTIGGGILPFFAHFLPAFIQLSQPWHSLSVIAIGALGLAYGIMALG